MINFLNNYKATQFSQANPRSPLPPLFVMASLQFNLTFKLSRSLLTLVESESIPLSFQLQLKKLKISSGWLLAILIDCKDYG
ncbi:hypothetical protein [Pseudanabaena sp. SR411]|uniref:hypothetical protein n=1 Tax=Pseudanabaena sp. SR411 TaxID=1980935 RepID=UPI000B980F95|nr:hypothetical protein [Pseudanabaena sp. SR411]